MAVKKKRVFAKVMIGRTERSYRGASLKQVAEIATKDILGSKYRPYSCTIKLQKPKKCPSGASVCTDGQVLCEVASIYMTGGRNPRAGTRHFRNKKRSG